MSPTHELEMIARLLRNTALIATVATAAIPTLAPAQAPFKAQVTVLSAAYLITVGNLSGFVSSGTADPAGPPLVFTIDRFFCSDNNNSIPLPTTYSAWLTPLWPNAQDMSYTRLGARGVVNAQDVYQRNAQYATLIDAQGTGNAAAQAAQSAIWYNINNPASATGAPIANPFGWFVVSQTESFDPNAKFGGVQELLAYSDDATFNTSVVPEPTAFLMLIPALVVVAGAARRRRNSVNV